MGLADDIINGKYRASVTSKKKKKEEESLADQIIAGTYRATITTPSEEELDDIAPVVKQEEEGNLLSNLFTDTKAIVGNLLGSANTGILQFGKTVGMRNDETKNAMYNSFNEMNQLMLEKKAKEGASEEEIKALEKVLIKEPVDSTAFYQEKINNINQKMAENTANTTNPFSKKVSELSQSIGNTLVGMGLSAIDPITGTTYFIGSATGSYYDEGIQRGMTEEEAKTYGGIMGTLEGLTEKVLAGQNIKGFKAILEGQGFKNALKAFGLEIGENALQEAVMPSLSEITAATTAGTEHLNYDFSTTEGWKNLGMDSLRDGIDGALSAILINGATKGVASATRVVNKINNGQEVTQEEIATAVKDTQEAGVDVEGVLQEELTRAAEKGLIKNQAQIEGLQQEIAKKTEELNNSQDAREKQIIQETINGLNEELNELTNAQQITDESELRKQHFTYEAQETDSDIRKAVYESASQVMNNTETTHKFVDVVAKIAEEKGTTYKFTNNEQLKQLGYTKEGMTVNGLVNENGEILINIDSAKALNTVVGHETTHLLEGTKEYDALKQVAIEYAKSKGDYDARIERLTKLYEGTNADIEAELTSDIVGEYLFTDENFVRELSVKQPTIFEKIRNFISDLVVRFKGTEQEKQLRQLQRTFEKAYKAQGTQTTGTKYSASESLNDYEQYLQDTEKLLEEAKTISPTLYEQQKNSIEAKKDAVEGYIYKLTKSRPISGVQSADSFMSQHRTDMDNYNGERTADGMVKVIYSKKGDNEAKITVVEGRDKLWIDELYVKNQKQGYGSEIVNAIKKYAEEKGLIVDSYKELSTAKGFWDKVLRNDNAQSTTDNQGRTLTKEQQEYFKDSKVRDEKGNLLTVYHGTEANAGIPKEHWFNIFDIDKSGRNGNMLGEGFYFTTDEAHAKQYAHTKGNVYETYLDIKKPLELDYLNGGDLAYNIRKINPYVEADIYKRDGQIDGYKVRKYLLDNGYDGIHVGNTWVAFNSNQIKNVDNTNPTTDPDIRYSLSEDNQGRKLSKEQKEYFKNVIPELKDENGNLKVLYHGTPNEFTQFNYDFIGTNGTAFGKGFYLTDDINIAKSYTGDNGNVMELYANITNPMSLKEITISKNDFKKFVSEIAKQDEYWIYDYGDIDREGFNKVLNYAVDLNYDGETNDVDLIHGILNTSTLGWEEGFRVLNKTLGYDGVIANEFGEGKSNVYVPFFPEQIKSITNENPTSNPDINLSLSAQNEEIAPTGQWNVRGEDIKLQVEEALSPLQETISNLTEQVKTMQENFAPTSQDIVEQQGQENFEHLPDDLMPPEIDETEFAPDEDTYEDVNSPVQERDMKEVGNRKVKAYQYEHPEVRPYFQVEADNMLGELSRRIEGERYPITGEDGYTVEWTGISRSIPEDIAYLKDNYGYSYEQIEKGLKAIIEDNGAENNAVSKRLEILIDERLTNGYVDFLEGYPIPPNQEYKNLLIENDAADYYSNLAKTLDDADIAPEQATMNTEPKLKVSEQVIPQQEKVAQNGNTEATEGKQRKWVETSTESEVVNREILPDDLDQSKIFYQPITNKETLGTANTRLSSLGYEKSVEYFNNQFLNKKTTVEDIVLGERLIQEAIKKGDTKTAGDIIQNVAILGTELGQKVQALSIIQRMTPEGQLKMLEKTINRGKVKGDKAFTDIELTQEMKDKILKTYNEDGSYDQDKLNEVMDEVKQEIADNMQVTAMDKINAWRYLSMLGNPKTHIRNLVSNVAMQGTLKVKNAIARTIEDIAPIENRTKTWKAASDEVTNFAKQTALEMKDVISGDSKYSESTDIKAKRQIFKTKVIEKLANLNSDMLEKEDWWFSKGAFESSFREFLTANGISTQADIQNNPELIEKGKNYAVEQAQIATFRQYSWLANKIRDIESKNAATQIAVGAVLPFKKTPINIAKTGLNYSPLGFAKTLTYDISQVKKGNMEASTLIDHIAQNTTGTALTLVGYMLAQAGFLNGAGDDDKEGKYDYQLGKQAYSINIGGNTYSLSWLSPVAMPLFVGANAYEQLVEGEEWNADVVLETLGQTLDPLSEMSFLSSLDSVLSSYDSGVQRFFGIGEAMAQNYVTQFVPTALSQAAATLDDTKRSTKVSGDSGMKVLEETYNKLIYKIPFLRETLEPSTDIWGNEVKQNENLFTRAFENFIAPYSRKESIATEIDNELKDLYSQTGDNGLLPSIPYNYVNYDGEKYNMSAEEYTDYKKAYGQTANDLLEDLFRTTTYQNATSEERADMVNDVYDYARDEAKLDYLGKEGVDYTNATKEGEEYYKVNDIKGAIDNDMTVDEYRLYSEKPEKYNFFKNNGISYRDYEGNKDLYNYAYEHQDKYIASKAITGDFETYYSHLETMGDFDAKDEYGNSVSGLKKSRVFNYINGLDLSKTQKMLMFKMQYPKDDDYISNNENVAIVQYVSNLDMDYADKVKIIESLGMTIKNGRVYWK